MVFMNCSDCVVFMNCSDCVVFMNCSDCMVFMNCSDCVVFMNCSDCVIFLVCFYFILLLLNAVLFMPFGLLLPNTFNLFGFPVFLHWAYLMTVILETRRAHDIGCLRFISSSLLMSGELYVGVMWWICLFLICLFPLNVLWWYYIGFIC